MKKLDIKTVGKAVKFLLMFMVFAVIALFVFRIIIQSDKHRLNDIAPNQILTQTYDEGNGKITALSHDIVDVISEKGCFMMYAFVYFPDAKQLQVTVQYNESVYDYEDLDITSLIYFDLGISDASGRISPTVAGEETFWMYTYRRLVFDNVEINPETDITVYMYDDENGALLSSHILHYAEQPFENYKLSKSELNAISGKKDK